MLNNQVLVHALLDNGQSNYIFLCGEYYHYKYPMFIAMATIDNQQ